MRKAKAVLLLTALLPLLMAAQTTRILIQRTNVIDVEKGRIIPNQNVLIEGTRIRAISSRTILHGAATVVDGNGKFLLPGLCDFNAYVL